jgi:cobalt-zinc-cadmium efflux system membrane fusion protein
MQFKKYSFLLVFAAISLAGSLSSCGSKEEQAEEDASPVISGISLSQEQMELAGVETGVAEKRWMRTILECTGQIDVPPQNRASVHSPVQGFIREINYLEGDFVKKGTVLAVLAHPDLIRLQREFLESKGRLTWLEQEKLRKESLAAEDAVAQKEKSKAVSDYQIELAHFKGLRAELAMIGLPLEALENEGVIQQSLALRAPVGGYITRIHTNMGDLVSPGDPLYEMVDPAHVHLELQVFAKDAASVRKGQVVECRVPGVEARYLAEVYLVGREVDQATKTVRVHGHFEKEPANLFPGTYVQAWITTHADSAWALPQSALVTENGAEMVYVQKGNTFEPVAVQTGRRDGDFIEVQLPAEIQRERLVLKGAYYLKGAAAAGEE